MHSLDEPLDLKLSITKLRAAKEKRERTLGVARHRALHRELGLVDDSPTPGSPDSPPSGTGPSRAVVQKSGQEVYVCQDEVPRFLQNCPWPCPSLPSFIFGGTE